VAAGESQKLLAGTSGVCQPQYDGNGNLLNKTDAESRVTTIAYDNLNRPTTKTYTSPSTTPNVTNTYNGLRLQSVVTTNGVTQAYTYTNGGRLQTSTQTIGSTSYPFSYGYYMDGSLSSVTYPSGRVVSYELANSGGSTDLAGRVHRVKSELGAESNYRVKGIEYGSHGLMESMTLGNDLVERWTYNAKRLQPYDIRLGTSGVEDSAGRWKFSYCAGALSGTDCVTNNGNIMNQQIQPLNIFQNYSYDDLNRISVMEESASASASPACGAGTTPCRKFDYDSWSNMYVSATRVMSPASFTPTSSTNFNTSNRLNIQGSGYDLSGNQTDIGGYDFAYDHEGRVKTSTLNSIETNYTYDGLGRRVAKSTGGSTTTFVYDASGNLAAEYGGTVTETGARYLTADHLGSTRLVTKQDQSIDRRIDYLPFGEFIPATVGRRTTALKYEASEEFAALTKRFTGKERDVETGLDYFGARYFAGVQGRFVSPDPVAGSTFKPQSLNLYAYAWNNPLRHTDPTGMVVSWEDSGAKCKTGETACRTDFQRKYEDRIKQLQSSKDKKQRAKGNALATTYQKLQDAKEVFHVVREGGSGSGELTYQGTPGHLYVEMQGSGSKYGEMPDVQKLAHEFKHGEQFLEGLLGFTNITGKWQGYRDDLVDEANAFMAGFMAEPVGGDQSKFLQGLGQAAQWGLQEVVKKLDAAGSPYRGRATQQIPITTIPPSVYAVPRSK